MSTHITIKKSKKRLQIKAELILVEIAVPLFVFEDYDNAVYKNLSAIMLSVTRRQ